MTLYYIQMFRITLGLLLALKILLSRDDVLHGVLKPPTSPGDQFLVISVCILMPEVVGLLMLAAWLAKVRQ